MTTGPTATGDAPGVGDAPGADDLTLATRRVTRAASELAAGRPVLVADAHDREDEVDAVLAADRATPEWVGWMVRHTSGYLCAPMTDDRADRLGLPPMVPGSQDRLRTAYTISADAAAGVTTGISAHDRARTARVLADPESTPSDLVRPGHLLPLRAVPGGVRQRGGHTEATVELCRLAGLSPVGVIGELVRDDGSMVRLSEAEDLARDTGLAVVAIGDLVAVLSARDRTPGTDEEVDPTATAASAHTASSGAGAPSSRAVSVSSPDRVQRVAEADLPTAHGDFRAIAYRDRHTGAEHLALVARGAPPGDPALVRVHSECLTGDALHSLRCDCGPQLTRSMDLIAEQGGVVIRLAGHEGRGIGIAEKIRAYALQDHGRDTVEANLDLGWPADMREYGAAAAILRDLGCLRVRLLTNNPDKVRALEDGGILVQERVPLVAGVNPRNAAYLRTKAERMGHRIESAARRAS